MFTIQYLRSVGFDINNELFADHSWYFRNALVRANYKNLLKGIDYSPIYLERFFRNLLLGDKWDLRNRYLHINPSQEWSKQPDLATQTGQVQAGSSYIRESQDYDSFMEEQKDIMPLQNHLCQARIHRAVHAADQLWNQRAVVPVRLHRHHHNG